MKLLLIEDNATMLATLQRSFERRGITVTTCSDGARALDRWRASVPDVVLLDLSLPGRDGCRTAVQNPGENTGPMKLLLIEGNTTLQATLQRSF